MNIKKAIYSAVISFGFFAVATLSVFAADSYTLFGDAQYVSPGNASDRAVKLISDNDPGYGGIDYTVPSGTTFADLDSLSSDFMPEADDTCVGGSPRFQIRVPETGPADSDPTGDNIFVYFGTDSGSPACIPGVWQTTTDLLDAAKLVDTSQLGGTFYDPYPNALLNYGSLEVLEISLVVDGGWAASDGEQSFDIDNTNIDGTVYDYEEQQPMSRDDCKDGGWQDYGFRNQGQCIRFVNTGQDSR